MLIFHPVNYEGARDQWREDIWVPLTMELATGEVYIFLTHSTRMRNTRCLRPESYCIPWATKSHGSLAAKEFFHIVCKLFPYPLTYVLTDNGSEFMKLFDQELRRLHKVHWHTYPRTPRMNAHAERFNRTIQEEFLIYHEELLVDPKQFNRPLIPWLLWFNADRPHWSLNLKIASPIPH